MTRRVSLFERCADPAAEGECGGYLGHEGAHTATVYNTCLKCCRKHDPIVLGENESCPYERRQLFIGRDPLYGERFE